MKHEIRIFFTALMFYTRIPCPSWVGHKEEHINQSTRYFPLIGWIVGGISALVFLAGYFLFDMYTGLALSMAASILTTGAFHEDGFADMCDGFGGGWTKEKILLIMKDSRMGAYGVIGIFLLLLTKFLILAHLFQLQEIHPVFVILVFTNAHALSRFAASTFIFTHVYVRDAPDSKAKPVAKQINLSNLMIGGFFVLVPIAMLVYVTQQVEIVAVCLPVYLMKMYLGRYFSKWIGGYTGDCLGATQQLCEIVFYLSLAIVWKFI
ncbi:adenosylcobinamide-GDP ribazoletransferase [Rapidithrix thailandica]|uniref:Adenosylcobinamide-GDP ribazoletransferase n=1 Tax=Rapidithrix thailandica TaxID=413964 RepID=A0AAW9S0A9_9BACT